MLVYLDQLYYKMARMHVESQEVVLCRAVTSELNNLSSFCFCLVVKIENKYLVLLYSFGLSDAGDSKLLPGFFDLDRVGVVLHLDLFQAFFLLVTLNFGHVLKMKQVSNF